MTRNCLYLIALFVLALVPRLYSAQSVGWNWDSPGSFTLINFDEGGSCRAALDGFDYSTFIGRQTIAISSALGHAPETGISGDYRAVKAYCHSPEHIRVARTYSAVTGALTVVLTGILGLLLLPARPQVAWTAAGILALCGFHVGESHSGTVDAPSVFFIYAFLTLMVYAVSRRSRLGLLLGSPLLLVLAIWTKYWVFAVAAYIALTSHRVWVYLSFGLGPARITVLLLASVMLVALATNAAFQSAGLYPLLALFYLLVPWKRVNKGLIPLFLAAPVLAWGLAQIDIIAAFTTGSMEGKFGSEYAAIGWNKLIRNPVDVLMLLGVALGLPACLFIPLGIRAIVRDRANIRAWLCLAPIVLFLLYLLFISPVTYYRHYLALVPAAALVSAMGLWSSAWSARRWFLILFFIWPSLIMVDLELDYHNDPRMALRDWYREHPQGQVFVSYYVNPPTSATATSRVFAPEYAFEGAQALLQGDYLILSENWYDTAFANELNGPLVGKLDRLIKTRPEYARFYRQALAGTHPNLQLDRSIEVQNFMPELVFHSWLYGTFQLFLGDLKIYRIVK